MVNTSTKQIENCILGLWLMHDTHPSKVKLHTWTCGSAHCFGGWVAVSPEFQAQGVTPSGSNDGEPTMDGTCLTSVVARRLFGDRNMFWDKGGHPKDSKRHTHHWNVVNRLEAQIVELTS